MFEFFLALFGGAYYGGRAANEKHKLKEADRHTNNLISEMQRDNDNWIRRVVDIKLESEINNLEGDSIDKIKQRILNEANITSVSDDMIIMGLLAQKGKIPKRIAQNGIRSYGIWDYDEQQRWTVQRRFMIWYDKELRRNGLNEPMLFVDGVNEHMVHQNIGLANPITTTSRMVGGRYFWASMRFNI